uniref:Uncharacterized protein n=1 Tax=Planktothrix agardhii TaxID=1160 RepID=A0A1J1JJ56_PLAAG|nr:protein of unknown function [Planktothrix agardhii]
MRQDVYTNLINRIGYENLRHDLGKWVAIFLEAKHHPPQNQLGGSSGESALVIFSPRLTVYINTAVGHFNS